MVRVQKWLLFLGPKFRFLVQKSDFCHKNPILVNDLGMTVNFPPWERFFDFPFLSYNSFRKKIRLTRQKVFPLPTVGAPSASNSPSAVSAQAFWDKNQRRTKGTNMAGVAGNPCILRVWTQVMVHPNRTGKQNS